MPQQSRINVGDRYGRLVVVAGPIRTDPKHPRWACHCDCGSGCAVMATNLTSGNTRSCGCLQREEAGARVRTHGESRTRLHIIWMNINQRCYDPNSTWYRRYGGRGIRSAWRTSYEAFRDWALANGYRDNLTIDRIDNDGHYEPANCRWATRRDQARNRSH